MYVRFWDSLIQIHTPAKLNLFLEVLGRRKDGFHEIETLMTPISMFDTLDLSSNSGGDIRLTCHWATGVAAQMAASSSAQGSPWDALPAASDNLVVKALNRLRQRAGVEAAAGLGGASSDAAAALVGGNRLWRLGWSRARLAEVAAEVGSDVPFFLQAGAAICRGRGERIERLERLEPLHVVVVRPPAGLSTAEVYRHCQPAETPCRVEGIVEAARRGCPVLVGRRLFNRLQAAAEQLSPWVARLHAAFDRLDCGGHQMSGSGTTYFGVCRHARHARHVAGQLRSAGWGAVFQVTTLSVAARQDEGEPH
ncbi:MAG: 4-(cytidine 5'-diphospho)-2-C-methyl-D-erythritol kinase [Planctomycetota bacterium]|nr:4-(cytidine 5'-diphospho)-2-C-methyl-D-erythritol kinase [Planctomycetota bacterium]